MEWLCGIGIVGLLVIITGLMKISTRAGDLAKAIYINERKGQMNAIAKQEVPLRGLRTTDAGKGWVRVWDGSELIAACPSRGQAENVVTAYQAQVELEEAKRKIVLLEQELEHQLRKTNRFRG